MGLSDDGYALKVVVMMVLQLEEQVEIRASTSRIDAATVTRTFSATANSPSDFHARRKPNLNAEYRTYTSDEKESLSVSYFL